MSRQAPATEPLAASAVPVGQKTSLRAVNIPLDCNEAKLQIDSTWHTDPASIAVWGLEISEDSGKTWRHWCTATRPGGPAFTDNGVPVNMFDVTAPVIKGAMFRPFIGVLKGTDATAVNVSGTLDFK